MAKNIPSDLEIAQAAQIDPIHEIAARAGLSSDDVEPIGRFKAKIRLEARRRVPSQAKYVCVTAVTPTPLGEGKTTTSVGLAQGLGGLGHNTFVTLRQPSMGPTFGIKGGAAGGGYSQVVPMEDFNLHLTGDIHAVSAAHNLLAAAIDNHLHHGNALGMDPLSVQWPRVVDLSDRFLRRVVGGLGGRGNGQPREASFDIAVASEVMAVLALAHSLPDLRQRLGRIVVGLTGDGEPVCADDLKVAGAMTVLLKDALLPNLLQTLEHTPALVHAGPFANIAHGNSSVVGDQVALSFGDYVVTEAGFGSDIGFEKFANIKCRASGATPDCAVVVATARAIKMHGSDAKVTPGKVLPPELREENLGALERGAANLAAHIGIVRSFGVPVVVAINRFSGDSEAEIERLKELGVEAGALDAVVSDHWARGGEGAEPLARAVVQACEQPVDFRYSYDDDAAFEDKCHALATTLYGAEKVEFAPLARRRLESIRALGHGSLPVCMAKTHLSLSHDPTLRGSPRGFTLPVRDVKLSAGAGFITALCGDMRTMPGLPSRPAFENVDIDLETGRVVGLF
ncbi:MAG: formate--tetrahydrofolate ligase [Myxococcota bacterium]